MPPETSSAAPQAICQPVGGASGPSPRVNTKLANAAAVPISVTQNHRKILRKRLRMSLALRIDPDEHVALATHSANVLAGTGGVTEFLPQVAHVHVDAAIEGSQSPAQH